MRWRIFLAVKATMGLRVAAEEEVEGLDFGEHGMHAYDLHLSGGSDCRPSAPAASGVAVRELATES